MYLVFTFTLEKILAVFIVSYQSAFSRVNAALLRDVLEVLLVDPPLLELLDCNAFRKYRLHNSVDGVDNPLHLGQLGSVDRATIFARLRRTTSRALARRNTLTSQRNLLISISAFVGFFTMCCTLVALEMVDD